MKRFQFPSNEQIQGLKIVSDLDNLRQLLRNLQNLFNPTSLRIFNIYATKSNGKAKSLTAKCYKCDAKLLYKIDKFQMSFILDRFKIEHDHFKNQKSRKIKHRSMKSAQQFLESIPYEYDRKQLRKAVLSKFNITSQNFQTVYNNFRMKSSISFQNFVQRFSQTQNIYYLPLSPTPVNPDVVLITNKKMKDLYTKYGDSVTLQLNLKVLDQFQNEYRQYRLGFLLGFNNKNKAIIFCIVLIHNKTKQNFKTILLKFIQLMGKQPQTLISDKDDNITQAINQIKVESKIKTQHMFNLQKYIQALKVSNKLRPKLALLLKAQTIYKYKQLQNEINQQLEQSSLNLNVFNEIKNQYNKVCSHTAHSFIGLKNSQSINESFNVKLKRYVSKKQSLVDILTKLIKLSEQVNFIDSQNNWQQIKYKLPSSTTLVDFQKLSRIVCRQVFQQFYNQFLRSYQCSITNKTDQNVIERNFDEQCQMNVEAQQTYRINQNYSGKIETFKITKKQNFYTCQCFGRNINGISCRHEIKLFSYLKLPLTSYFNQRWIINSRESAINTNENKTIKRGAGKSTHTNRIK